MLDEDLAREIRRTAPRLQDRKAYFTFRQMVVTAAHEMSNTDIRRNFNAMLLKHGRVVTAIVVAATLIERKERLEGWQLPWAQQVVGCWPHTLGLLHDAAIKDGLHPSRVCEYAGSFIRANSEG